ncbi:MAG: sigma 54-interacting transcriptional regulator [candidate division KSB1 bacterium]|nr:sigma 54-interacting transcriptional regulator [candidate division KSB1 bacterium]
MREVNIYQVVNSLNTSDLFRMRNLRQPTIPIIASCEKIQKALDAIEKFAASDALLLITGETGTGKELWARAIHLKSRRANRPFVPINCAQFQNEDLLVSELFGHRKGSFTGALRDRKGAFEAAAGGTVFLDEIGELGSGAQALLLRTLDTGEIKPLGENIPRKVDVRIIAATDQNLTQAIRAGTFKQELYYRLSYLRIHLPSLRERGPEEIQLLAEYFLKELNNQYGIRKRFSPEVIKALIPHRWPGNVRELKGLVEHLYYQSGPRELILPEDFPLDFMQAEGESDTASELYRQMVEKGKTFWEAVKEPFMWREIKRSEVREVIRKGLQKAGSYKKLLPLFQLKPHEYKKFVNFLDHHDLKP